MCCYDLSLKYIGIIGDIDRAIEKKAKASNITEDRWLDTEINKLEIELFNIKKILRDKGCYDLTLKYIGILGDIDRAIENKSKIRFFRKNDVVLEQEMKDLENKMIEIQEELKAININ